MISLNLVAWESRSTLWLHVQLYWLCCLLHLSSSLPSLISFSIRPSWCLFRTNKFFTGPFFLLSPQYCSNGFWRFWAFLWHWVSFCPSLSGTQQIGSGNIRCLLVRCLLEGSQLRFTIWPGIAQFKGQSCLSDFVHSSSLQYSINPLILYLC